MVEKDKLADTEWLLHKAEQFNVETQKRKDKAHATYEAKKAKIKRDEQEAAADGKGSSAYGPVGGASGRRLPPAEAPQEEASRRRRRTGTCALHTHGDTPGREAFRQRTRPRREPPAS